MKRALALRLRGLPGAASPVNRQSLPHSILGSYLAPRPYSVGQLSPWSKKIDVPPFLMAGTGQQKPGRQPRQDEAPAKPLPYSRRAQKKHQASGQARNAKRKAEDHALAPPARRRKGLSAMQFDEAHIRRTMKLPSRNQVPSLPSNFHDYPKDAICNRVQGIGTVNYAVENLADNHYRCTLTFTWPGFAPVEVVGQGTSKKAAENAASLHLTAKTYALDTLKYLFPPVLDALDSQTMKEERDAKLDIYDYAARYGCIPTFYTAQGARHRGRRVLEVTVRMPEHDIEVTGRGVNLDNAEVAAGLKFKEAAENYHAKQGTASLVIKDSTAINVRNAKKFFDFYKNLHPSSHVSVDVAPHGKNRYRGRVVVDGVDKGPPTEAVSKRKTEDLAMLVAAVTMTKETPNLLRDFLQALRAGNGDIMRNIAPFDMDVDEDCVVVMRDTILKARGAGLRDEHDDLVGEDESLDLRRYRNRPALGPVELEKRSIELARAHRAYLANPALETLRKTRADLPMNQYASKVRDLVERNVYSIIIGATGSGKTTQVPQILLDEAIGRDKGASCNVVCTQPRRIAATSVARRVADERAQSLQDSVGYQVRFDARLPKVGGSVTYCTAGILLQQLQHSPDEVLDNISHLIIDEVHERDKVVDFLMVVVKKVMAARLDQGKPVPKVILMSATMDSELFASYFKNRDPILGETECPSLSVPGRTFPVAELHLESILEILDKQYGQPALHTMYRDPKTRIYFEAERQFARSNPVLSDTALAAPSDAQEEESIIDWKKERKISADGVVVVNTELEDALVPIGLVATTIAHIVNTTSDGATLVFLPGLDEMLKVDEMLRGGVLGADFRDESKYKLYMLHSSIPQQSQTEVFNPVPSGVRKVILSTNIAETSVTIPDVQYVVDTGKLRESRYDQARRITKLQCTWISKSNSKQRAGRAGRVQNGNYYALFSKARYQSMRAVGLPELLRSDLQETCLDIKAQAFQLPIREFLAEALEPPSPAAVDTAVRSLIALDALTDEEKLTPLGRLLSSLPVHPTLGKMIVLGVIFRCLDPMLIIGAASEERSLFVNPVSNRRQANNARSSFVRGTASDHMAMLNAFREVRQVRDSRGSAAAWEFASRNFIHFNAFKTIDSTAQQILEVLVDAKLVRPTTSQTRRNNQYGDPVLNENSDKPHVVKALALAGLYPNIAARNSTRGHMFRTQSEMNTMIHPSSVNIDFSRDGAGGGGGGGNMGTGGRAIAKRHGPLLAFNTLARSNDGRSMYLRDTTLVTPLMACLFGGRLENPASNRRTIQMDGWLPFYVHSDDRRAIKTIIEFKKSLQRMLTGAFADLQKRKLLSDDRVRAYYADGLVEVLGMDLSVEQPRQRKGPLGSWLNGVPTFNLPTGRPESNGRRESFGRRESSERWASPGHRDPTGRRESVERREPSGRREPAGRQEWGERPQAQTRLWTK